MIVPVCGAKHRGQQLVDEPLEYHGECGLVPLRSRTCKHLAGVGASGDVRVIPALSGIPAPVPCFS